MLIPFDIPKNVIKRLGFNADYSMNKQEERNPLQARISDLREPAIKLNKTLERLCKF